MSIDKPFPFETVEEGGAEITRTYAVDWEKGRISGFVDGKEAAKQFAFTSEYILYDDVMYHIEDNQGSNIYDVIRYDDK